MHHVTILYAVVTAIVQGLTEYLPISSSGHLALVNHFFGVGGDFGLSFMIWLHGATLLALLAYFWRDIIDLIRCWAPRHRHDRAGQRRIFVFIVLSTLVTGPMGIVLNKYMPALDSNLIAVGIGFIVTTIFLVLAEVLSGRVAQKHLDRMGAGRALFIGFMQGLAIPPGISRSGTTIAAGLISGLDREQATRYAFLAGIPAIVASFGLDVIKTGGVRLDTPTIIGFVLAGVIGYLSIAFLLALVKRVKLYGFAVYTGLLAIATLIIGVMKF
ncbi:MAG: undecaprenyl-diphosphate phosphatase [Coriobacteriia bacterium]|nr:undecaprenyl-diphosphate phosphatase [Coriobacteriia bacterium]